MCHFRSGARGLQDGRAEVHPGPYSELPVGLLVLCCALPVAAQLLSLLHQVVQVVQVLSVSANRCWTGTTKAQVCRLFSEPGWMQARALRLGRSLLCLRPL